MKLCFSCKAEFSSSDWVCPVCQWKPAIIDNFYSFAPDLADNNDGLDSQAHHGLDKFQSKSFWFRKRNKLIQDLIYKYFNMADNVLEIGCGSGYVLSGIRDALPFAHLTATEIYSNGLKYAVERVSPPCQFLQVDARNLPFKREFDFIGAFDVLEHIDDHDSVIMNIRESLKPGGGVLLTVPQHPFLWSQMDELACHKRRYSRRQLSLLLMQHGFDIVADTSFMFFLLPLMLIRKLPFMNVSKNNPSAELELPTVVDKAFGLTLDVERILIRLGMRFPLGGSRVIAARLARN